MTPAQLQVWVDTCRSELERYRKKLAQGSVGPSTVSRAEERLAKALAELSARQDTTTQAVMNKIAEQADGRWFNQLYDPSNPKLQARRIALHAMPDAKVRSILGDAALTAIRPISDVVNDILAREFGR